MGIPTDDKNIMHQLKIKAIVISKKHYVTISHTTIITDHQIT